MRPARSSTSQHGVEELHHVAVDQRSYWVRRRAPQTAQAAPHARGRANYTSHARSRESRPQRRTLNFAEPIDRGQVPCCGVNPVVSVGGLVRRSGVGRGGWAGRSRDFWSLATCWACHHCGGERRRCGADRTDHSSRQAGDSERLCAPGGGDAGHHVPRTRALTG